MKRKAKFIVEVELEVRDHNRNIEEEFESGKKSFKDVIMGYQCWSTGCSIKPLEVTPIEGVE